MRGRISMMFQEAAKLGKEANPREMWLTLQPVVDASGGIFE